MPNVLPTNLIMEQSAHCDWDWLITNEQYYDTGFTPWGFPSVRQILQDAVADVQDNLGRNPPYVYAFCEMAYLRRFVEEDSSRIATLQALQGNFTVSSGGFTSAENLIGHGETFIRNYLLGRYWLQKTIGLPVSNRMWIPDDFGHDAQLPIVLVAMGMTGVGFWRIPGTNVTFPIAGPDAAVTLLNEQGRDFVWRAADGSSVQAHWLGMQGYGAGNDDMKDASPVAQAISENQGLPTPWIFVPIDNDFSAPFPNPDDPTNVLTVIGDWNRDNPQGVQAQLSTFDGFLTQVAGSGFSLATLDSNPMDGSVPYMPNPFWSGCYVTRVALKQLHYAATRTLLFAEGMELLVEYLASKDSSWSGTAQSLREAIATAWDTLVPSTHHDYITGTSAQIVYEQEQLSGPWSVTAAASQAQDAQTALLSALAGALPLAPGAAFTAGCFNNLGFVRSNALVTTAAPPGGETVLSATVDGTTYLPVQYSPDGTELMLLATVPPLGYTTAQLSTTQPPSPAPALGIADNGDGTFTMWNDFVRVTISAYGITDLRDLPIDPGVNVINGMGNQLVWYEDDGDLYRFGNEMWDNKNIPDPKFAPATPPDYQDLRIAKTQDGPLLKQVTATFSVQDPNDPQNLQSFTMTYTLVAGENILRMTTTGAAPSGQTTDKQGYTVMTAFPFNSEAAYLTYGTPYHWDTRAPRNFFTNWPPPSAQAITFEPTHEFLVAQDAARDDLFAIYHSNSVAWGIAPGGVLIGCLLRNTTGHGGAASGYDEAQHTLAYAIRLPGGTLQSPAAGCTAGAPLGEALAYNNPVPGVIAPATTTAQLPALMSIASTTNPTGVITAAKVATADPSQWVLRVYQPTNSPLDMAIQLDPNIAPLFQSGGILNVAAVNAMEAPIDGGELDISPGPDSFTFTAPRALATFSLIR
ncbi:MAG TPA: hypothetical protein VF432_00435 [Thermoanaerobaculia bacterium]